jgi:hypothetical protein
MLGRFNSLSRRDLLKTASALALAGGHRGAAGRASLVQSGPPRVLPEGQRPDDVRLGLPKDLDCYFPFVPPIDEASWARRADEVRRRILVSAGLWPMPTRPDLVPVIHGKVERDDYTVEKVYFESFPGLWVTGSLYRPLATEVALKAAVLSPHGHWANGRFHDHGEDEGKRQIERGGEKFEKGGRHPVQSRCVGLARMGCIVFSYDMIGYTDSVPITEKLAHRFEKQRPELSTAQRWGLFSPQAELRLQNVLGLQLWNSIRSLDFMLGLPDVDSSRIGVTGESGGGSQTFLLAAVDRRLAAAFPAVMVGTAMQGGCTCENACYLRVDTGNVEFAALFAPKPLGMTGANDWTKEIETKGLPELKQLWGMVGRPGDVEAKYLDFEHNYNAQSRARMYAFFKRHLDLASDASIEEREYEPLTVQEASVWDDAHPKPPCDDDAEVRLLHNLDSDSTNLINRLIPTDSEGMRRFRRILGGAIKTMVGRELPGPGEVIAVQLGADDRADYNEMRGLLQLGAKGESVPAIFLHPNEWGGRVVLWLDPVGKAILFDTEGKPIKPVARLLEKGISVASADLMGQGEFLENGKPMEKIRTVGNPREFLGYTVGYNHPLFAQRVHDVLTLLSFVKHHELDPKRIDIIALNGAARWAAAAAAVCEPLTVDALALGTRGFRFASINDVFNPDLWPGAVKYGDLPALLALCSPSRLWLADEGEEIDGLVHACYGATDSGGMITMANGQEAPEAVEWILGA